MGLKLYELADEFRRIGEAIEAADGEVSDGLLAELEAIEAALPEKCDSVATIVREREASARALREEADRLTMRARADEGAAARLKGYLKSSLEAAGLTSVKGARFTVGVQNNPVSIRWPGDPDSIPDGFRRVVFSLDGEAAKSAHKAGELPAAFEVHQGTHLRIR